MARAACQRHLADCVTPVWLNVVFTVALGTLIVVAVALLIDLVRERWRWGTSARNHRKGSL